MGNFVPMHVHHMLELCTIAETDTKDLVMDFKCDLEFIPYSILY